MNAVLLAAGYGTRLYPLTKDRPKALLPVGGRPIIDHLVERLDAADRIERLVLVSNRRFVRQFEDWAAARTGGKPLDVLDDGSTDNDNRLGAVADIAFALERIAGGTEPTYVVATDNLPRFDLCDAITAFEQHRTSVVFACNVEDRALLTRMGVAELGETGRVVSFEEKPERPRGSFRVPPFYCYTAEAVQAIPQFLAERNNPDAPGHYLAWLVQRQPVHALRRDEGTYDIGTLESYRAVQAEFGEGG